MEIQDKYGIQDVIESHFKTIGVLEVSDRHFTMKCIAAIWEDVYVGMPLKDTEDRTIEKLLEIFDELHGVINGVCLGL